MLRYILFKNLKKYIFDAKFKTKQNALVKCLLNYGTAAQGATFKNSSKKMDYKNAL